MFLRNDGTGKDLEINTYVPSEYRASDERPGSCDNINKELSLGAGHTGGYGVDGGRIISRRPRHHLRRTSLDVTIEIIGEYGTENDNVRR